MSKISPIFVLCIGVFSSGSTWCFNAARKLLEGKGGQQPISFFADHFDRIQLPAVTGDASCVIKTHAPHPATLAWAHAVGARKIVSVRDPRDCVVSLMSRFEYTFAQALSAVTTSAAAALEASEEPDALVFRYEDGFTEDVASIWRIAEAIRITPTKPQVQKIFRSLQRKEVIKYIDRQFDTPVAAYKAGVVFDAATHWHPRHLGDGAVGKYKTRLDSDQVVEIERACWRSMKRFGHALEAPERLSLDGKSNVTFANGDRGTAYLTRGFSAPDVWGAWMRETVGSLDILIDTGDQPARTLALTTRWGDWLASNKKRAVEISSDAFASREPIRLSKAPSDPWIKTTNIQISEAFNSPSIRVTFRLITESGEPFEEDFGSRPPAIGLLELSLQT